MELALERMVQENNLSRVRTRAYSHTPAIVMAFVSEAFAIDLAD